MIGMTVFRRMSHDFACLAEWHGGGGCPTVSVHRLHMRSTLDSLRGLPIPRQQLIESIDQVSVDHALEHVVQIRVGFDIVQFGSFNERTERRPARSAVIRSSEQMILSTEGNGADRALDGIGVELDTTIV